jgi:hypothetical protein
MASSVIEDEEAERIAGELAAKYGSDAIEFVRNRAEVAQSVGDEVAWAAWQSVLEFTETLVGAKSLADD